MAEEVEGHDELERTIVRAAKQLGYSSIKELQLEVIKKIIIGHDVFAVLPTGFGKSLCYGYLPLVFDEIYKPEQATIVCVILPLVGIIEDQVRAFATKGLLTGCVSSNSSGAMMDDVKKGKYQLVYFTPEALLEHSRWHNLLRGENYSSRLRVVVIDEAHTVIKWGDTFRKTLLRIREVRSIVAADTRFMALTATASKELRRKVSETIGLVDPVVIAVSPCKSNISYGVSKFVSLNDSFGPILQELKGKLTSMGRIIIYCRRFEDCSDLYCFFKRGLGKNFTYPTDAPCELSKYRLVEMFTSSADQEVKSQIIESFGNVSSPLRIVCATVAFGMGIDTPDVRQIIHYGAPDDLHSYIQETGRGGRDDELTIAVLFTVSKFNRLCSKKMLNYQSNKSKCRRDLLFQDTDNYHHLDMGTKCLCCDICASSCDCGCCAKLFS